MTKLLYLDPGTGSLLLYALVGIFTSLLFIAQKYMNNLRLILVGRNPVSLSGKKFGIVIYAENSHYFRTFLPLVKEFIRNKKPVTYITADDDDPAFGLESEYVHVICPGNQYRVFAFLNSISADIIVSTTAHLDIYMWKRSKNVKKYIHVFHDPGSIDTYEKYGLSFYDVIIGSVPECEAAQRFLDEKRNLPQKNYYTAGCMYMDLMVSERNSIRRSVPGRCVLYAPSWGAKSSLSTYGESIIANLLDADYTVIFRPHPQSLTNDRNRLDKIESRFAANERFRIDMAPSGMESMVNSDIMVSDFSGVIFDYSILFGKPVLLASGGLGLAGYEGEDIPPNLQFNIPESKRITRELSEKDIPHISAIVDDYMGGGKYTRCKLTPNLGHAGEKVYEIVSMIWEELA